MLALVVIGCLTVKVRAVGTYPQACLTTCPGLWTFDISQGLGHE
jgi:hypothetical protein